MSEDQLVTALLRDADAAERLSRYIGNIVAEAVLSLDEDMPGGASAFMLQQVLEVQDGWWHLDAAPRTLAASPNRPAYGPDGDYFTKPNRESIVNEVYKIMRERQPWRFPSLDS